MLDLTQTDLYDLVPDSIRDDPQVNAAIAAIDGELKQVSALVMVPVLLARIDELDGTTLDHLAWQFDSKTYRDSWPVELKRSVIKSVIAIKSKKGTLSAVNRSLSSLGSATDVTEWWQTDPPGAPYTFSITVTVNNISEQPDADFQDDLRAAIDDTKSARSLYDFNLAVQASGELGLIGAARAVSYRRLSMKETLYNVWDDTSTWDDNDIWSDS